MRLLAARILDRQPLISPFAKFILDICCSFSMLPPRQFDERRDDETVIVLLRLMVHLSTQSLNADQTHLLP